MTPLRRAALLAAAHLMLALAIGREFVFAGRLPYVRDVTFLYAPDLVFVGRSLAQGVWPLWTPLMDGGRPFLFAYLPDLVVLKLFGPWAALRAELPLHLWIAACGASWLARVRGGGALPAWATGAFYALSGLVLACGNFFPFLEAAAWAPWVIAAALRVLDAPSPARVSVLAVLAALEGSSTGVELVVQTAIVIAVLAAGRVPARRWIHAAAAALLAAALAAPFLLGGAAVLRGTARQAGFGPGVALSWSTAPLALPALVLPRYFGDMSTFSDLGYWGQALFEGGYPYFVSTYLGLGVLLLAALGASRRLALLALAGVAVALGAHGPLAPALVAIFNAAHVRGPTKFLYLAVIAVVLMAGDGIERLSARAAPRWAILPGALVLGVALVLLAAPARAVDVLASLRPAWSDPRARYVMAQIWPPALLQAGTLALVAGLVAWRRPSWRGLAALAAVVDLLAAGADLNPSAPSTYFTLPDAERAAVETARAEGPYRWFSYGASGAAVTFRPDLVRANRDLPLFAVEVSGLRPRTDALQGLEGVFDEDRTALAPAGATFTLDERRAARFRDVVPRLRAANVRFVASYEPLPEDLVRLRATAPVAELLEPLRLYEIVDPLPRASWGRDVDDAENPPAPVAASVRYEAVDPHTVRLHLDTPPGTVVVRDRFDPGWHLHDERGPIPLAATADGHWAFPATGGTHVVEARFTPAWRAPALGLSAVAWIATLVLIAGFGPRGSRP